MNVIKIAASEALYRFRTPLAPPPDVIFLVINSVCNLNCKMCDVGQHDKTTQFYNNMNKHTDLPISTIFKLVNEVAYYKPTFAIISTEPLLYKQWFDVVSYMKKMGCKVQLTTNGVLLEENAEKIVDSGIDVLYVSIDGPREVHDLIRGRNGSWKKSIDGIYKIHRIKKERGVEFPKVQINFTISQYNFNKLCEFIDSIYPSLLPEEMDEFDLRDIVDHITFSHLNFITTEMSHRHNTGYRDVCEATVSSAYHPERKEINIEELDKQIKLLKQEYGNYVSFVPDISGEELYTYYFEPWKRIKNHSVCKVPWRAAQIFADGSLGISTRCYNLDLGNITNESFLSLWNGPKMRNFRKELARVNGSFPACYRCCGVF